MTEPHEISFDTEEAGEFTISWWRCTCGQTGKPQISDNRTEQDAHAHLEANRARGLILT